MSCLSASQTTTVIGLLLDIVGVIFLAMPIIGRSRQYRKATGIARKKKDAAAKDVPSYMDEEIGFTVESLIRDIRLAWLGVALAVLGFAFQVAGTLIRN
jgi:hypothetical protein